MRTLKALACAAALTAGLGTAVAQNVYSLNVVGYYNVTLTNNQFWIVANQLNTTNNQIQYVIPTAQDFTTVYKWNGSSYGINQYVSPANYGNGWDHPTDTLNPGEAAMIKDPGTGGGQTLTFVGEVLQGALSNNIPTDALCFRSYSVPMAATLAAASVPGEDFDITYVWTGRNYGIVTTYTSPANYGNGWDSDGSGNGPLLAVGQGFGYKKYPANHGNAWIQNFTVQ
jgi:hypothetical protein